MTSLQRAVLGAVFGALIILFIHPLTRPAILFGIRPAIFDNDPPIVPQDFRAVPDPRTSESASLWIRIASDQIVNGKQLSQDQLLTITEITQKAAEQEPDNAFWLQAYAVFLNRLGHKEEAIVAWRKAASKNLWNDWQTEYLEERARQLGPSEPMSWQYSAALRNRSGSFATLAHGFGESLIEKDNIKMRLVCLLNGRLIRDGGRSFLVAQQGYELIEKAARGRVPIPNRSEAQFQRFEFVRKLNSAGMNEQAIRAARILSENEAFEILVMGETSRQESAAINLRSIIIGTLPGALLGAALLSAMLGLIGFYINKTTGWKFLTNVWYTSVIALIFGLAIYFITGLLLPAIFGTGVIACFLSGSQRQMDSTPASLHYSFDVLQGLLGTSFLLSLSFLLIGASLPAREMSLAPDSVVASLPSSQVFLTVACLSIGTSFGVSQVYAFVLRRIPTILVGRGLWRFGMGSAIGAAIVAAILTPLLIAVDRFQVIDTQRLFRNEPRYFLSS